MADSADFKKLLKEQKEKKQKEVISIAEATQDFALQIQKDKGYGQAFFRREGISNAAVSVVQNFTNDLDGIADASEPYKNIKELIGKYNVLLKELPGSVSKGRFSQSEFQYIADVIAPVVRELGSLTGPLLRSRLALRDFVKQFKPIKIADRLFGKVPIIGGLIKRKIERQEAGEQELRAAERTKQREASREARRGIEDSLAQDDISSGEELLDKVGDTRPKGTQAGIAKSSGQSATFGEELAKEKAADDEEVKGLFEMIAESTYETNENVKKLVDEAEEQDEKQGGFFSNMLTGLLPLAALTGLGGILTTAITGAGGLAATLGSKIVDLGGSLKDTLKNLNPFKSTTPKKNPTTRTRGGIMGTGMNEKQMQKNQAKNVKPLVDKNKNKGKNIAKKFAKGVVRGAGRVFLPLAAALSIFDAATGVAQADELLDKDEDELTFRDKASAGFAGFLSGLTFGLVDKKKTAKFLAGDSGGDKGVDNLDEGTFDVMPDSKGGTINNLEKDNFALNQGSGSPYQMNNNAQVNNNNVINKTDSFLPHMIAKNKDNTIQSVETGTVY